MSPPWMLHRWLLCTIDRRHRCDADNTNRTIDLCSAHGSYGPLDDTSRLPQARPCLPSGPIIGTVLHFVFTIDCAPRIGIIHAAYSTFVTLGRRSIRGEIAALNRSVIDRRVAEWTCLSCSASEAPVDALSAGASMPSIASTFLRTSRIAAAAAGLMSGVRPGISVAEL